MAKVVAPVICRIEVIGKPRESKYGEGQIYRPVLFLDESKPTGSEEAKIWKNMSDADLGSLRKGDRVQLVPSGSTKDGKPKHNIVPLSGVAVPATPPVSDSQADGELSSEVKRAIATHIQELGKLYGYCWDVASTNLEGKAQQEESIKCAASSLFIATQKKFGL